jgi:hypothetical protein
MVLEIHFARFRTYNNKIVCTLNGANPRQYVLILDHWRSLDTRFGKKTGSLKDLSDPLQDSTRVWEDIFFDSSGTSTGETDVKIYGSPVLYKVHNGILLAILVCDSGYILRPQLTAVRTSRLVAYLGTLQRGRGFTSTEGKI